MGLKVIGAGLPRTGTASLKVALQILLQGRCYHMSELHEHPEHWRYWGAAAKGETINWEELFSGYSAAVDGPTCFLARADAGVSRRSHRAFDSRCRLMVRQLAADRSQIRGAARHQSPTRWPRRNSYQCNTRD